MDNAAGAVVDQEDGIGFQLKEGAIFAQALLRLAQQDGAIAVRIEHGIDLEPSQRFKRRLRLDKPLCQGLDMADVRRQLLGIRSFTHSPLPPWKARAPASWTPRGSSLVFHQLMTAMCAAIGRLVR